MNRLLLTEYQEVHRVDRHTARGQPVGSIIATDDEQVIREWAQGHGAEPATGEATSSGPATIHVQDGGAGVRFNFPGASAFRPIEWDEWFANFHRHDLLFVCERGDLTGRYRVIPKSSLARAEAVDVEGMCS